MQVVQILSVLLSAGGCKALVYNEIPDILIIVPDSLMCSFILSDESLPQESLLAKNGSLHCGLSKVLFHFLYNCSLGRLHRAAMLYTPLFHNQDENYIALFERFL